MSTLIEGMAKAAHGCAWTDHQEEMKVSLSGMEIMGCMPMPPSQEAQTWAEELMSLVIARNPPEILHGLMDVVEGSDETETLGHYLAMEAMGHGVSWEDDHEPHGLDVPHQEAIYYCDEGDYV